MNQNTEVRRGTDNKDLDFGQEFRDQVRDILREYYNKDSKYWKDEEEYLEDCLNTERVFATKVYDAVKEAIQSGGEKVNLLLDVDQTIGVLEFAGQKEGSHPRFIIRPVLLKLLEELRELCKRENKSFDLGFISGRSEESIRSDLESGGQLAVLNQYVGDKKRLIMHGQTEGLEEYADVNGGISDEKIGNLAVVNRDELLKINGGLNLDDLEKLVTLNKLVRRGNERFVVVDDQIYPGVLNKKNGMFGVSLKNEGAFDLII
jgi:hypothetical protein